MLNVLPPRWAALRRVPLEAVVWTAGLLALACTNPEAEGLIEGCLFKWMGVTWCPGCGLGHAVAYLFRGEIALSFQTHPLGAFAVAILVGRVVGLVRDAFRQPAIFRQPASSSSIV